MRSASQPTSRPPTLYTAETRSGGRCIVSEPFDRDCGSWQAIPPSSFVSITSAGMSVRPFAPQLTRLALAG